MKSLIYRGVIVVLTVMVVLGVACFARAEFPEKPIQVLVGWPVGAANDTMDRAIAASMQKILKQPVIVQNVPGAGGSLVLARVKTEKSDGYTIFQTGTAMYFQTPHMRVVNYDPIKDFAYLGQHARFQNFILDRPDNPWKNYDEMIAYAKKNPKKVKFATQGVGGTNHIMMEAIAERENIQWIHVPYNISSEVAASLLGKHVDIGVTSFGMEDEHIKAGRLRVLLAMDGSRSPLFPHVPTIQEKGSDFSCYTSACWSVPANTPKNVQKILEKALLESFKDPVVRGMIDKWNMVYDPMDGPTVSNLIAKNYQLYGKILKKIGVGIYAAPESKK